MQYVSEDGEYYYNFWSDGGRFFRINLDTLALDGSVYVGGVPIQGNFYKKVHIDCDPTPPANTDGYEEVFEQDRPLATIKKRFRKFDYSSYYKKYFQKTDDADEERDDIDDKKDNDRNGIGGDRDNDDKNDIDNDKDNDKDDIDKDDDRDNMDNDRDKRREYKSIYDLLKRRNLFNREKRND